MFCAPSPSFSSSPGGPLVVFPNTTVCLQTLRLKRHLHCSRHLRSRPRHWLPEQPLQDSASLSRRAWHESPALVAFLQMLPAPPSLCAALLFPPSSPSPQILVRSECLRVMQSPIRHYLWLGPTSDRINSSLICVPTVLQTDLYDRAVFHLLGKLFISLFLASHLPGTPQVCKNVFG